ncbi:hypothetical protein FMEXI_4980 [Fusarium mexicanum]|uniref:Uncharacterized protein n=1 Tax=Fusarium mexicanum TaxID=751941 RepID=A0A8H5N0L1_9HYPO|nr:hypothetical protein FMEXI_4980 [Fusarium mexicanum]
MRFSTTGSTSSLPICHPRGCELSSKNVGLNSLPTDKHAQAFANINVKYLHRNERDGEGPGSSEIMPLAIDSDEESNDASDDNAARTSGSGTQPRLPRSTRLKAWHGPRTLTESGHFLSYPTMSDGVDTPPDVNAGTAGSSNKDTPANTVTATSGCAGTINSPEVNTTISGLRNADTQTASGSEGSGDDGNANEPIEVVNAVDAVDAVVDRLISSGQNRASLHSESPTKEMISVSTSTAASSPIETVVSSPRTVTGLSSENTNDSCEARDMSISNGVYELKIILLSNGQKEVETKLDEKSKVVLEDLMGKMESLSKQQNHVKKDALGYRKTSNIELRY